MPPAVVLQRRLSPERLAPYARATGSLPDALRLHRWNTAISAAFFEDLANVEVVLRNALDDRLQAWHVGRHAQGEWWDDPVTEDWITRTSRVQATLAVRP